MTLKLPSRVASVGRTQTANATATAPIEWVFEEIMKMSAQSRIAIVGQGYVGLPVAMRAVDVGYSVIGIDVDQRRIADLKNGLSYVDDISDEVLKRALATGRYLPTTDYDDANAFDVAVITVPTPLRENLPDLSYIEDAARSLAARMKRGATVGLVHDHGSRPHGSRPSLRQVLNTHVASVSCRWTRQSRPCCGAQRRRGRPCRPFSIRCRHCQPLDAVLQFARSRAPQKTQ